MVSWLCCCLVLVSAFLIQSVMVVSDLLLFYFSFVGAFGVLGEAVEAVCCFFWFDVVFDYDGYVDCPGCGDSCIINVVYAVGVAEAVLGEDYVFVFFAENAKEDAPALDGHVYAC